MTLSGDLRQLFLDAGLDPQQLGVSAAALTDPQVTQPGELSTEEILMLAGGAAEAAPDPAQAEPRIEREPDISDILSDVAQQRVAQGFPSDLGEKLSDFMFQHVPGALLGPSFGQAEAPPGGLPQDPGVIPGVQGSDIARVAAALAPSAGLERPPDPDAAVIAGEPGSFLSELPVILAAARPEATGVEQDLPPEVLAALVTETGPGAPQIRKAETSEQQRRVADALASFRSIEGLPEGPEEDVQPEELTPEEAAEAEAMLVEEGVEPDVAQAVTGQGELGEAAKDTGMGVGTLLAILGASGLAGVALGKATGEGGLEGLVTGLRAGATGLLGAQTLQAEQAREQFEQEAVLAQQQAEAQKEQLERVSKLAEAVFRGDVDAKSLSPEARFQIEAWMGAPLGDLSAPPKSSDPIDQIRDLSRAIEQADLSGLKDEAAILKLELRNLLEREGFAPDFDQIPTDQALDIFVSGDFSREELTRQFTLLADRLVREAGVDKQVLENLAKERGIEDEDPVKKAIERAVGEVPGPERGQTGGPR